MLRRAARPPQRRLRDQAGAADDAEGRGIALGGEAGPFLQAEPRLGSLERVAGLVGSVQRHVLALEPVGLVLVPDDDDVLRAGVWVATPARKLVGTLELTPMGRPMSEGMSATSPVLTLLTPCTLANPPARKPPIELKM